MESFRQNLNVTGTGAGTNIMSNTYSAIHKKWQRQRTTSETRSCQRLPFTAYGSFRNCTGQNYGTDRNRESSGFVNSAVCKAADSLAKGCSQKATGWNAPRGCSSRWLPFTAYGTFFSGTVEQWNCISQIMKRLGTVRPAAL